MSQSVKNDRAFVSLLRPVEGGKDLPRSSNFLDLSSKGPIDSYKEKAVAEQATIRMPSRSFQAGLFRSAPKKETV